MLILMDQGIAETGEVAQGDHRVLRDSCQSIASIKSSFRCRLSIFQLCVKQGRRNRFSFDLFQAQGKESTLSLTLFGFMSYLFNCRFRDNFIRMSSTFRSHS